MDSIRARVCCNLAMVPSSVPSSLTPKNLSSPRGSKRVFLQVQPELRQPRETARFGTCSSSPVYFVPRICGSVSDVGVWMKVGTRALEYSLRKRAPSLSQSLSVLLSTANGNKSARFSSLGGQDGRPLLKNLDDEEGKDGCLPETEQGAQFFSHIRHHLLVSGRSLCLDYTASVLSVTETEGTLQQNLTAECEEDKSLINPRVPTTGVPKMGTSELQNVAERDSECGSVESGAPVMSGMVVDGISQQNLKNDTTISNPSVFAVSTKEVDMPVSLSSQRVQMNGSEWIGTSGGRESMEEGSVAEMNKRLKVEVAAVPHAARAWEHWNKLGAPKLVVAPMVDQSELPFRMLCRKYGATAAYTPMLHSRLFAQDGKYRKEFTTCPEDRPLFVQFCANNPETLLEAGRLVQDECDYVDINFGCPQRIAKRGNYGAFLMDDLPLVRSLVTKLACGLTTPVSCKIRMFPDLESTIAYARMLEEAGCSLLAIHGRTRDQKNGKAIRADWEVIKAVKSALSIPVLANGNIRWLEDVDDCIKATGVDGVMSAESLLENPALFGGHRMSPLDAVTYGESALRSEGTLDEPALVLEYLDLCEKYPVPARMIRAHVHRMLGPWFRQYPELREELNRQYKITTEWLKDMVHRLIAQHKASLALGLPRESGTADQVVNEVTTQLADVPIVEPLRS